MTVILIVFVISFICLIVFCTIRSRLYNDVFYKKKSFPQFDILEENFKQIQKECLDVYNKLPLSEIKRVDSDLNYWKIIKEQMEQVDNNSWHVGTTDDWNSYGLVYKNEIIKGITKDMCPVTTSLLEKIGKINKAGFSLLKKHGKIDVHTDNIGPNYNSMAYHLCLIGTSTLTVNGINTKQKPGKVIIFNSEYEHYVVNNSDNDRIILYIEFEL